MRILLDAPPNSSCDTIFKICAEWIRENENREGIKMLTHRDNITGDEGAFVEHFDYKDLKMDGYFYTASMIQNNDYDSGELVFFDKDADGYIDIIDKEKHWGKICLWRVGSYQKNYWIPENFHFLRYSSNGQRRSNVVGIFTNL